MTENIAVATIGFPDEIPKFLARNPGFAKLYPKLLGWAHEFFADQNKYTTAPAGVVTFGLLTSSTETFFEIVCLAAHGFGSGAQARLRTMFEYVSIAALSLKDAEQAERFVFFQHVEQEKELARAVALSADGENQELITSLQERLSRVRENIQRLKEKYGKGFQRSWHEGFEQIAEKLGWKHHYFHCYLLPNRHVHASPLRFESRVAQEEQLYFEAALDYDCADGAVRGACTLLVLAFFVMNDLVGLGKGEALQQLSSELTSAYKNVPNKTRL